MTLLLLGMLTACGAEPPGVAFRPAQTIEDRRADRFMVAAAHPLAVEAGLDAMRRGGSAVDAAVVVQMVLGLVEPQETGVGGGGFLLYREGRSGRFQVFDGREVAPAAARPDRFLLAGRPAPSWFAIPTGRAVGVPGLVAMLELAHSRHGRLPWGELMRPAIELAETGVEMPARLQRMSRSDFSLRLFADTRRRFVEPASESPPRLRNPEYADTLRLLASEGPGAFYDGPVARAIVERVAARRPWPGDMDLDDLRNYSALLREPLCLPYRQWTVCGAPPPSSGGIAVLQILALVERFDLAELGPGSADALHLLVEAQRLAFADRERYVGDPDFVDVPTEGLLDPAYLQRRSQLIDARHALREAPPGAPATEAPAGDPARPKRPSGGTSHFTIVDADGNLVALTSSIEAPFGSRMASGGFLLNNQLTDFSFDPRAGGRTHPNAVAPGKRPRSSMSPVIVLDEHGEVRLAIGARGGPRIIAYVVKALVGVLDWELGIQEAIALPNFVYAEGRLELERGTPLAQRQMEFEARGHRVRTAELNSGLHGIERFDGGWRGGADPRMEGVARGD